MMKRALGIAAALLALAPSPAAASAPRGVPLFVISKSENRNQVVYAVRVDADCRLAGDAPVYAYWRMLERGPSETEPLLSREQPAYGLASQQVLAPVGADGERVARVRLRALPDRTIVVRSARVGGVCTATATATVGATAASLSNVHARLRWLFGVASLTLTGRVPESGAVVEETLEG